MMKIMVTVGPSCEDENSLKQFAKKTNLFRLNGSHGTLEWHRKTISRIRKLCPGAFILVDIPGIKPRTNNTKNILHIENYNFLSNTATDITIQTLKYPLEYQLKIDTMIFIENIQIDSKKINPSWIRKGITLRKNNEDMVPLIIANDTISLYNEDDSYFTENDLNSLLPDSKELNYWELKQLSSKRPEEIKLKVDYHFKLAFSFTSIIMILFGIGLSIKKPRTNYTTGIGLGIIVIFLYYLGIKFGQSLGYSRTFSPFMSVWIINFIFLSIGIWLFSKIRT